MTMRARPVRRDAGRAVRLVVGLGLAAALLAACGDDGSGSAAGPTEDTAPAEAQPVTVQDAYGEVTFPERPERIVADSVGTLAHLTALGIVPVGAAVPVDISPAYLGEEAASVSNVVADDGWTVSVEKALALQPDVIVSVAADYNQENCERYKEAVATFCWEDGWRDAEEITERFLVLGEALGRTDEAEAAVAAYEQNVADTKAAIAAGESAGKTVGVVRFDAGGFIGVRTEDVVNAVIDSLGLEQPTWPEPGESGYVELSLETLDVLDRADILMVTTDDNVDVDELEVFDSPLWKQVRAVAAGDAHFVGAWNGADLIQLGQVVDTFRETVG